MVAPDQFYTGLIAKAYAPLRGTVAPPAIYERFVRRYGEPALEIGCGHGEPLLDLVAAGLAVWGLDSSADMLALCADAAIVRGLTVQLVCQPMEDMTIDCRFASMYFAGPTFQLLLNDDTAVRALRRIAAHLTEDGRVLVPLFRPGPSDASGVGTWREHVSEAGEVVAFRPLSESYRVHERRVDTTLQYRRGPVDDPIEVVERVWSLRWYEDGDFESLLSIARLEVDRVRDFGETGRSYVVKHAS